MPLIYVASVVQFRAFLCVTKAQLEWPDHRGGDAIHPVLWREWSGSRDLWVGYGVLPLPDPGFSENKLEVTT